MLMKMSFVVVLDPRLIILSIVVRVISPSPLRDLTVGIHIYIYICCVSRTPSLLVVHVCHRYRLVPAKSSSE